MYCMDAYLTSLAVQIDHIMMRFSLVFRSFLNVKIN